MPRKIPPAAPAMQCRNLLGGLAGFIFGETYLEEARKELREYFGARHVFLLGSGKAALLLILEALSRLAPDRDEVVIPAYTCYSVPSAIARGGFRIVPCDIADGTFGFDRDRLKEVVGGKTLCVVSTHLFGIPEDIDGVNRICSESNAFCVEDAAQAMGGVYKGRSLGTASDVGFFSLGRGKNIACGRGGIVLTNSDSIAGEIERGYVGLEAPGLPEKVSEYLAACLMCIFIHPRLYWIPANIPFLGLGETVYDTNFPVKKLSGVNAGMFRGWRERLERGNRVRQENGNLYRGRLGGYGGIPPHVPYLRFPYVADDVSQRERLLRAAEEKGLGFSSMYPLPVHEIEEIRERFAGTDYPTARRIAERIVTLPTHGLVSRGDVREIMRTVEESRNIA